MRMETGRFVRAIDEQVRAPLLDFVDQIVPGVTTAVWLTGSRARGDNRPDSDWDVIAFTEAYRSEASALFESNQISRHRFEGGFIELVIANPAHWNDPRRYMADCREYGIRLRDQHDAGMGRNGRFSHQAADQA